MISFEKMVKQEEKFLKKTRKDSEKMDISYWLDTKVKKEFPSLEESEETKICVIGGGMTGLTTAYYLSKAGHPVILLEKDRIGEHTSGNTTAKITSQHGLFYDYLLQSLGIQKASQYYFANEQAIRNIESIVENEKIDCHFQKQNAYVFTESEKQVEKIKKEVNAVTKIGGHPKFVKDLPIPVSCKGAICFENQAQFHPYLYMQGLANCITKYGGKIYENTKVYDINLDKDIYEIKTDKAKVRASIVVLATHYPIINLPGFYFMKMYQEVSYLIAFETQHHDWEGLYINEEKPTISLRKTENGLVLLGGEEHKTGEKVPLKDRYANLEAKAKHLFPDAKIRYRWNTEDCIPLDKIPYIGEFSNLMPNVYVATGYKKWGMTHANIAANIITDKIQGKTNPYVDVFDSTRLRPMKNYQELMEMGKQVGKSLVLDKLKMPKELLKELQPEEGKILEVEGQKVGVYCDIQGNYHFIKPVCSHLGCELTWNPLDKVWDCPCHGSRFSYDGESLEAPSIKHLDRLEGGDIS